jgi:hypothetical protein
MHAGAAAWHCVTALSSPLCSAANGPLAAAGALLLDFAAVCFLVRTFCTFSANSSKGGRFADPCVTHCYLQAGPPATLSSSSAVSTTQQQQQQQRRLYRDFLQNLVVQEFKAMSRCLPDLASQAAALWPRYMAAATAQQPQKQRQRQQHDDDDEVRVDCRHHHACCYEQAVPRGTGTGQPCKPLGVRVQVALMRV